MRRARVLATCVGLGGCMAFIHTDARVFPQWEAASHEAVPLDCARVTAVAVKTGKTGVGITVTFEGTDPPCTLRLTAASFEAYARPVGQRASVRASALTLPPPPRLSFGVTVDAYLAFPFDDNAAYDDDALMGRLVLETASARAEIPFEQSPGNR